MSILLLELEGTCRQLPVLTLLGQELLMRAALDYSAMLEHHDRVRIAHGRETVCDNEDRASLHEGIHAALDQGFGTGIHARRRLVEDEDRRVCHGSTGDCKKLALALREVRTVCCNLRIVALGKAANEGVGIGNLCCLDRKSVV